MTNKTIKYSGVLMAAAGMLLAGAASAFDMGNMMNPSKWGGGGNDRDDDDDYYGGGPGYGYGGGPGYGYGGAPGYGGSSGYGSAPTPTYVAPGADSDAEKIRKLEQRIKQLEQRN
ncbi:MAG: hypothetical protein WBN51_08280 [Gammaproteobacteria bacterium]